MGMAWGQCRFGRNPVPVRENPGWSYIVIASGEPTLITRLKQRKLCPNTLITLGPKCEFGWTDEVDNSSSILMWQWLDGPRWLPPSDMPLNRGWLRQSDPNLLPMFVDLHKETRRETLLDDSHNHELLAGIKLRLDAEFQRSQTPESNTMQDSQKLKLATEWMKENLELRDPVGSLADYLGISPAELLRFYRKHAGAPPRKIFLELKMLEAIRRLSLPDMSVKRVAFDLGYRHQGDFTRAFSRFFGTSPTKHQLSD